MASHIGKTDKARPKPIVGGEPSRLRSWRASEDQGWGCAADAALGASVSANAGSYDRRRVLPRLIAIDPDEIVCGGAALDRMIRARLERALRAERQRGKAGHWAYDLSRHLGLAHALACESKAAKTGSLSVRRETSKDRLARKGPAPETKSAARMAGRR